MITLLRLGHRLGRDSRVTTHCGLVARAFGAGKIILSGDYDKKIVDSLKGVSEQWGGDFDVEYDKQWMKIIKRFKEEGAVVVHLTMYGMNLPDKIGEIRKTCKGKDLLVIVGSQKVPGEVYHLSDYNIAVGNTPHSEISALALFLDRFFEGKQLDKKPGKGKISIIPQERGKKTVEME
ncbi:MAG: tRNA (cytidine(56)-2'-O)-methyltransferase [Candidatus Aenigmarchaeota archaeon]|nr:tRNA (cytidine(56)-2'-O)-methyltransferase [Candidatus Aenigmarchaeota archaeon]